MAKDPRAPGSPGAATHAPSGHAPSEQRRRLLKAAASAAPVIATFSSGSAFANASIHQCVINAANAEQAPASGYLYVNASSNDRYVRATAVKQNWTRTNGSQIETATTIGLPRPTPTEWFRDPGGNSLGQWASFDTNSWDKSGSEQPVNVLLLWDEDAAGTGFDLVGTWPKLVQARGSRFGVEGSCLCSVDPQMSPWCV